MTGAELAPPDDDPAPDDLLPYDPPPPLLGGERTGICEVTRTTGAGAGASGGGRAGAGAGAIGACVTKGAGRAFRWLSRRRAAPPPGVHRSSALMTPSCTALATSAAFVGAARPTAAYLARTRCRWVLTEPGEMNSRCPTKSLLSV